ncbi:hypothetical protein PIROE2DRAFT_3572 [Piromyces sp. E2]|nr:hypothetical protein PIROE2DRAFT_3572 [Piromyces sp. E2]|eukprot:OUM68721.1 hypothetical protein PIROE2DRAFT_3572 [Piromyces sp. E2]
MDLKLFLKCFPEVFKELFIKQNLEYKNDNQTKNMKRIVSTIKVFKGELTFYSYVPQYYNDVNKIWLIPLYFKNICQNIFNEDNYNQYSDQDIEAKKQFDISLYTTENGILLVGFRINNENEYFEICHEKILKLHMNENKIKKRKSSAIFYLRDFAFEITSETFFNKHNIYKNDIHKSFTTKNNGNKTNYNLQKFNNYKLKIMKEFGIIFNMDNCKNSSGALLLYLLNQHNNIYIIGNDFYELHQDNIFDNLGIIDINIKKSENSNMNIKDISSQENNKTSKKEDSRRNNNSNCTETNSNNNVEKSEIFEDIIEFESINDKTQRKRRNFKRMTSLNEYEYNKFLNVDNTKPNNKMIPSIVITSAENDNKYNDDQINNIDEGKKESNNINIKKNSSKTDSIINGLTKTKINNTNIIIGNNNYVNTNIRINNNTNINDTNTNINSNVGINININSNDTNTNINSNINANNINFKNSNVYIDRSTINNNSNIDSFSNFNTNINSCINITSNNSDIQSSNTSTVVDNDKSSNDKNGNDNRIINNKNKNIISKIRKTPVDINEVRLNELIVLTDWYWANFIQNINNINKSFSNKPQKNIFISKNQNNFEPPRKKNSNENYNIINPEYLSLNIYKSYNTARNMSYINNNNINDQIIMNVCYYN